jgi:regulator of cell morphogenesis and NO signaling
MEHEHETVGSALARMRMLTSNYQVPADGCGSFRALYDGLASLEADLHIHIHKENNILFPRAAALEAELTQSGV